jgi:hypothetical protein
MEGQLRATEQYYNMSKLLLLQGKSVSVCYLFDIMSCESLSRLSNF